MTDFPYALDLDILDTQGRKIGMFHVRAPSAPDFIHELAEVDEAFALHLGKTVANVRTFGLLSSELGAVPVANGGFQATPAANTYNQAPPVAPAPAWSNPVYTSPAPSDPWPTDAPPSDQGPPRCQHGDMRYVKAGTSQAGKPYGAFYGCTADRNDPSRCKSVSA